jgi:hypothetical protein
MLAENKKKNSSSSNVSTVSADYRGQHPNRGSVLWILNHAQDKITSDNTVGVKTHKEQRKPAAAFLVPLPEIQS